MDKEHLFLIAKKELTSILDQLTYDRLKDGTEQLKAYADFFDALSRIETSDTKESKQKKMSESQPEAPKNGFSFERKLKGGYLPDINIYVPEKIVRNLALTDGDIVKVTPKKEAHFFFELEEKGAGARSDRGEVKYGVVEKDGDLWICRETLSGKNITINESPFTIHLKPAEINEYHLHTGDIVDIAYSKANPAVSKVVWKHQIEDNAEPAPLPSGNYKNKSKTQNPKIQQHPALVGKALAIIGNIDRYSTYRDRLLALGAKVEGMDGKEDEERIASLVKKSDLVLIIIPAVSHQGSAATKKYCKSYHIPFTAVDSISLNAVTSAAIRRARKSKSLFH